MGWPWATLSREARSSLGLWTIIMNQGLAQRGVFEDRMKSHTVIEPQENQSIALYSSGSSEIEALRFQFIISIF